MNHDTRIPSVKPGAESVPARPRQEPVRVLVVDDDAMVRRSVLRLLKAQGLHVVDAPDGESALERLQAGDIEVLLADLRMPRMDGMQLLREVQQRNLGVEVVIMTAYGEVSLAVEAVRAGAFNFLKKPFNSDEEVALAVTDAAEHRRYLERDRSLAAQHIERSGLGRLIGASPAMQQVYRNVLAVAQGPSSVLILGESGTGKELIAREIHDRSARANKPFVAVNLGSMTEHNINDELFGHARGAFTGAYTDRAGLFEVAHGGTLFLDEIGELPVSLQPNLLRALEEKEVRRMGENRNRPVDVRVISATNVDLWAAVERRQFRDDLFFRLNVVTVPLPPLRERREDIDEIALYLLKGIAARLGKDVRYIDPRTRQALRAYSWPGNVRQLLNAIESAVVLAQGDTLTVDLLSRELFPGSTASPTPVATVTFPPAESPPSPLVVLDYNAAKRRALADFEKSYIDAIMEMAEKNVSRAARMANLDRSNFKRVLRRVRKAEQGPIPGDVSDDEDEDDS